MRRGVVPVWEGEGVGGEWDEGVAKGKNRVVLANSNIEGCFHLKASHVDIHTLLPFTFNREA